MLNPESCRWLSDAVFDPKVLETRNHEEITLFTTWADSNVEDLEELKELWARFVSGDNSFL